jgi:hypothetical protein
MTEHANNERRIPPSFVPAWKAFGERCACGAVATIANGKGVGACEACAKRSHPDRAEYRSIIEREEARRAVDAIKGTRS